MGQISENKLHKLTVKGDQRAIHVSHQQLNIRKSTIFNFNIIDHKYEYVHLLCHRIDYSFLITLHRRTISLYWCVQRLHWAICCQFDISPTHYNTSVFVQGPTPRRPRLHHVGMYCTVVHGFLRTFSFNESTNLSLCKITPLKESVTLETQKNDYEIVYFWSQFYIYYLILILKLCNYEL